MMQREYRIVFFVGKIVWYSDIFLAEFFSSFQN